jgi:hypothetical protein
VDLLTSPFFFFCATYIIIMVWWVMMPDVVVDGAGRWIARAPGGEVEVGERASSQHQNEQIDTTGNKFLPGAQVRWLRNCTLELYQENVRFVASGKAQVRIRIRLPLARHACAGKDKPGTELFVDWLSRGSEMVTN